MPEALLGQLNEMWIPQAACGLHQIAVQSAVHLSRPLGMAGPQLAAQQNGIEPVHACICNLQDLTSFFKKTYAYECGISL